MKSYNEQNFLAPLTLLVNVGRWAGFMSAGFYEWDVCMRGKGILSGDKSPPTMILLHPMCENWSDPGHSYINVN